MCCRNRLQLSVWNGFAVEAQQKCIRALYQYARNEAYVIGEYQIESLGNPKLIIIPSPFELTDHAWQVVLDKVRAGATLLISGRFDEDAHFHGTGRQNEVGLNYEPGPLTARENVLTWPEGEARLTYSGDKTTYLDRAFFPDGKTFSMQTLGKGKIIFSVLPLELNDNLQAVGDVYKYAAKQAGVTSAYSTSTQDPAILICPTRFPHATLYVVTSESAKTADISFEDHLSGKNFSTTIEAGRAAMLVVGDDGHVLLRMAGNNLITSILSRSHGGLIKMLAPRFPSWLQTGVLFLGLIGMASLGYAQGNPQTIGEPDSYGPYNATFLAGGDGLSKPIAKDDSIVRADSPWSVYGWVKPAESLDAPSLIAGFGNPEDEFSRYIALDGKNVILWTGKGSSLSGAALIDPGKWHFLAATFDGDQFRLYGDGVQIANGKLEIGSVSPVLQMAPPFLPSPDWKHFGGTLAYITLTRTALTGDQIKQLAQKSPDFSLIEFEEGSKPWPVQTRGQAGYRAPQDPATMPHTNALFLRPVAKPLSKSPEALQPNGEEKWVLASGWKMTPAPKVNADGTTISQPDFKIGLVAGHRTRHRPDDHGGSRHLSRSRLWP